MKRALKVISILLAVVMTLLMFSGCNKPKNDNFKIAMIINGENITVGEYIFYLSELKYQIRQTDPTRAEEEFWKLPYGKTGLNNQEYVLKLAKDRAINRVIVSQKFNEMKLKLSDDDQSQLEAYIASFESGIGTKAEFDTELQKSGLTRKIFTEMQSVGAYATAIIEAMYGVGTAKEIKVDELKKYFYDKYVRIKHVLVKYVDAANKPLADKALLDAVAKTNSIFERAKAGENFDAMSLNKDLNDDPASISYPDGIIFNINGKYTLEYTATAFEMKVGEIRKVDAPNSCFIMKKYALDEKPELFDIKRDEVYQELAMDKFDVTFKEMVKNAKVEETPELKNVKFEYIPTQSAPTEPTGPATTGPATTVPAQ